MDETETKKDIKASDEPFIIDVTDNSRPYHYEMKKIWVTKNTIKQLRLLGSPFGWQRNIRKGQVERLVKLLYQRKHFESPLVFEKINGGETGYRVLDGGHRREAMDTFLQGYEHYPHGQETPHAPSCKKIGFYAAVYDFNGMTDAEKKEARREIYSRWNTGTRQSTDDYIMSYRDDIPIFERIGGTQKTIPCSIYGVPEHGEHEFGDTLKFKDFVGGYLAGIKPGVFGGGYSGNPQAFVDELMDRKDTVEEDAKTIEYVWKIICQAYDLKPPYKFKAKREETKIQQHIARTTPFYALSRIILENKGHFTDEEIVARLQRPTVIDTLRLLARYGGRELCKKCHGTLIYYINEGYELNLEKQFYPKMSKELMEQRLQEIEEMKRQLDAGSVEEKLETEDENIPEEELKEEDKKWKKFRGKYK